MDSLTLYINISTQTLTLRHEDKTVRTYAISTALNGPGELSGSGCTPRGDHIVRAKIGASCGEDTVFVARRSTGECYSHALAEQYPDRDWILSRILWLQGCEPGRNRLGQVDTMRRYIYIHGSPETAPMGVPMSHGCVRMRTGDIVELFDLIEPGISVRIE